MPLSSPAVIDATHSRPTGRRQELYLRVRGQILAKLIQDDVQAGQTYKTENELADELGVSRNTVRKAMAALEAEGYLTRRRGVGTIIERHPFAPVDPVNANHGSADSPVSPSLGSDSLAITPEMAGFSPRPGQRLQVVVQLPRWNDNAEGFYTGRFLQELTNPRLDPPLAVEIRHYEDVLVPQEMAGRTVIAIDPAPERTFELQAIERHGGRVLVLGPYRQMEGMMMLSPDRRPMVRQMVHHFYDLGHRRIGIINSNPIHMGFQQAMLGYMDGHRELGLSMDPNAIIQPSPINPEDLPIDVDHISAWVCTYYGAVTRLALACQAQGKRIPEDVSVVCLDDFGPQIHPHIGKTVAFIGERYEVTVDHIHQCLVDWPETMRGQIQILPHVLMERETINPPPVAAGDEPLNEPACS